MSGKKEKLRVLNEDDDMRNFNRAFKVILVIALLIITFSLFSGIFAGGNPNISGVNDLEYLVEQNVFYDEANPEADFVSNIRNQTLFNPTDPLLAGYSFTDDINGNDPINWEVYEGIGSTVTVLANLGGHNKIVEVATTTTGADHIANVKKVFDAQTFGTIELWFRSSDVDAGNANYIYLKNGATNIITLNAQTDKWQDSVGDIPNVAAPLDNIWGHIQINFELSEGGYMGLDQYKCEFIFNGISGGDRNLASNEATADNFYISPSAWHPNYQLNIDAVGFGWNDNYTIGDNFFPSGTPTNITETDRWEFYNNEDSTLTIHNQQTIPFWDELMNIGKIVKGGGEFSDDTSVFFQIEDADHEGLERNIGVANTDIIQVNFTLYWGGRIGSEKWFTVIEIDSFDDTLLCRIRLDDNTAQGDLRISYYNGGGYIELEDLSDIYTFLYLNISIATDMVKLSVNSSSYYFPVLTLAKDGIGDIKLETYGGGVEGENAELWIDSIGVYIDGVSEANDWATYFYDLNGSYEHSTYNLLSLNATGFFGGSITTFHLSHGTHNFFPYQNSSEITLINSYDDHQGGIIQEALFSATTNTTFEIYSLRIEGVKLTEGVNTYYFDYIYGSVNPNISYFYADLNNRLRFSLTINDNNTEFIQASVDLPDITSENRSISVGTNIDGEPLGYFGVNYTDNTITLLEFPYYYSVQNLVLPQTKMIEGFTILITDGDLDDNGLATGYVTLIKLIYYPDVSVAIATTNLLVIIVPLIVMLTPTFAMYTKFGKNSIVPMLILMSVICFATQLIPTWLFFIIILCSGGFLFMKQRGAFLE